MTLKTSERAKSETKSKGRQAHPVRNCQAARRKDDVFNVSFLRVGDTLEKLVKLSVSLLNFYVAHEGQDSGMGPECKS